MSSQVILVVEDEPDIREGISILLGSEGYTIKEAGSGEEALKQMDDSVELVILDIMLPGIDGLEVCRKLRETSNVPILFLTAKSQDVDKAIGLGAGGDDYLAKPFSFPELVARVQALLRRYTVYRGKTESGAGGHNQGGEYGNGADSDNAGEDMNILTCGRLKIDRRKNAVWKDDQTVSLTDIEYNILLVLAGNPMQVYSSQELYEAVWNEPYIYSSNSTIMVHIRRLRTKIEDDPQNPVYIRNIWGKGYRFEG